MKYRQIKFKVCKGYEKYVVDINGKVYSTDYNHTGKTRLLKQWPDKDGYLYVFFVIDRKRTKKMVHRLVAENFLVQPTSKHQVNHKNGIRHDNILENLEWVTASENSLHGWRVNGRKVTEKQREHAREMAKAINHKRWGSAL